MSTYYVPGVEETDLKKVIRSLQQLATRAGSRERLTSNRIYYVSTTGSDSNTGLSSDSSGSLLTIQKAMDIASALDFGGFAVTIQVGAGTYTAGCELSAPTIGGTLTISGDIVTPSNVVIATTGGVNGFKATNPGTSFQVQGFKVTNAGGGVCVYAASGAAIQITGSVEFGAAAAGVHCLAAFNSTIGTTNGTAIAISGGAQYHIRALSGSNIINNLNTVTVSGTPNFTGSFIDVEDNSTTQFLNTTYTGAATGTRFLISTGGGANTNGGGANFFPGNVAGITTAPGWYA